MTRVVCHEGQREATGEEEGEQVEHRRQHSVRSGRGLRLWSRRSGMGTTSCASSSRREGEGLIRRDPGSPSERKGPSLDPWTVDGIQRLSAMPSSPDPNLSLRDDRARQAGELTIDPAKPPASSANPQKRTSRARQAVVDEPSA